MRRKRAAADPSSSPLKERITLAAVARELRRIRKLLEGRETYRDMDAEDVDELLDELEDELGDET